MWRNALTKPFVLGATSQRDGEPWSVPDCFNGRLRDECLNEHWFVSLAHSRAVIEAWRREYNEERPKKSLGGLTPAGYAKKLADKSATLTPGL